ncbi:histone deacetylase [Myxosarcina sp. GI1]|uniref:histone deacetylase family protein n=1 Tax=Myxosarcina sp. GI1 TaxID=1541065 RepID=UPI00055AF1BD|nr:histone deacetylase [Myxosarcina sp. GI1]
MLSVIYSPEFLEHDTGYAHPECPARLTAIAEALQQVSWQDKLEWLSPTPIENREVLSWVRQIHTAAHIERIKLISEKGGGYLDGDTILSARSYEVALLAVNAWLDGVDWVLDKHSPAFVLARPPGHHATAKTGMGFCLFSNAAIAANYALQQSGVERVAILDWDVHHGNGTEAIVEHNSQIIYCSLHQHPCYPGTGAKSDRGKYNNVLNLPMNPGSTIEDYQPVFTREVVPFLSGFEPDLLIVSAGYDANREDPLAGISLHPDDYAWLTKSILPVSSRILFGLEGGYHLDSLAKSVVATLASCL